MENDVYKRVDGYFIISPEDLEWYKSLSKTKEDDHVAIPDTLIKLLFNHIPEPPAL